MKLGEVLKKERERKKLTLDDVSGRLGISNDRYERMELGDSPAEEWGPRLALIAISLQTPTSRLIAATDESPRAASIRGECGRAINEHREKRGLSQQELAAMIQISTEEMQRIEEGSTPLETYGPLLLEFSRIVNQPVFNLFYPCGLPVDELSDYP